MSSGDQPPFTLQESKGSSITSAFNDMDSFINMDMYNSFPRSQSVSATSSQTNLSTTSSSKSASQPSFQYDHYPQAVMSTDYMSELSSGASSSVPVSQNLFDMDAQLNAMMPAFFFPENNNTVNPSSIQSDSQSSQVEPKPAFIPQPPPQFDGKRLYAGIHSQRAAYNQQLQMQQRMMAEASTNKSNTPSLRRESSAASSNSTSSDLSMDERISHVLNSLRPAKAAVKAASPGGILPHIARMRKDEEEMDEDERLLASEEGKKLSSKERRQLRNKVSARAFRSRRKEYITQLEAEVSAKTTESAELRAENTNLKSELTQLQEFARTVLKSPAFSSFLADMEKQQQQQMQQLQQVVPQMAPPLVQQQQPSPNYRKDPNPNMSTVGDNDWMFAPVGGAPPWAGASQVFSMYDMPSGPPVLQSMSGKALHPAAAEVFDWSQFPPPVDGFSPNRGCGGMNSLAASGNAQPQQQQRSASVAVPTINEPVGGVAVEDYSPPADLYDASKNHLKIADRIEALSPGVGLDALLERLESVITGQADVADAFGESVGASKSEQQQQQQADTTMEDYGAPNGNSGSPAVNERKRCRTQAEIFDAVEASYKRVGAVVGV